MFHTICRYGMFGNKSNAFRQVEVPQTRDHIPPPPSTSPAFTMNQEHVSTVGSTSIEFDAFPKVRRPDSSAPSDVTKVQTKTAYCSQLSCRCAVVKPDQPHLVF